MNSDEAQKTMKSHEALKRRIKEVAVLYLETVYEMDVFDWYGLEDITIEKSIITATADSEVEIDDIYDERPDGWSGRLQFQYIDIPLEWLDNEDLKNFFFEMKKEKVTKKEEQDKLKREEREHKEQEQEIKMLKQLMEKYPEKVKEEKE